MQQQLADACAEVAACRHQLAAADDAVGAARQTADDERSRAQRLEGQLADAQAQLQHSTDQAASASAASESAAALLRRELDFVRHQLEEVVEAAAQSEAALETARQELADARAARDQCQRLSEEQVADLQAELSDAAAREANAR